MRFQTRVQILAEGRLLTSAQKPAVIRQPGFLQHVVADAMNDRNRAERRLHTDSHLHTDTYYTKVVSGRAKSFLVFAVARNVLLPDLFLNPLGSRIPTGQVIYFPSHIRTNSVSRALIGESLLNTRIIGYTWV